MLKFSTLEETKKNNEDWEPEEQSEISESFEGELRGPDGIIHQILGEDDKF